MKARLITLLILLGALMFVPCKDTHAAMDLDVERFVLDNGLTVLHVKRDNLPVVKVTLLIKSGALREPAELSGLASLTASLLTEGTRTRSSTQISQEVEFIGASLGASAGHDTTSISLSVLRKDVDKGFDLMSDILLRPAFPRKEIKRKKEQIKGGLKKMSEDPGYLAGVKFNELVYGEHPYGRQPSGTEESVDRIGRGEIMEFYRSNYVPNNAILSVVGMLSTEELRGLIDKYLSGWEPREVPAPDIPAPVSAEPGIRTMDRDLTQATIIMGHLGVPRLHPDYYALQVMNYILGGGGFSSRMMERLRDELGLTYGVYSTFSSAREAGSFLVNIKTKNSSAIDAMDEIRKLIRDIREKGVTIDELFDAKAYLTGSFPRRIDTMGEIASFLASVEYYGLGLDYPARYAEKINAVTLEDVKRVAREHISEEGLVTVVVARQSEAGIEKPEKGDEKK